MTNKVKRHPVGGASANRLGGLDCAEANFTLLAIRRQDAVQVVLLQRAMVLISENVRIGAQMQHVLQGGAA